MHSGLEQLRAGPVCDDSSAADRRKTGVSTPPWIAALRPYRRRLVPPGVALDDNAIHLDSNEGIAPPASIVDQLVAFLRRPGAINHYPDEDCSALVCRLAAYVERPEQEIVVFCGADGALEAIVRAFMAPHDEAILVSPSYDQFRVFVELAGAQARCVDAAPSPLAFDSGYFLDGCGPASAAGVIYVVNPNNPAGYLIDSTTIAEIADAFPHRIVIVDETYIEFAANTRSSAGLLDRFSNLVVVRSFSKAFGLAGLRLGYAIANPAIAQILKTVRNGKAVTALAQAAGLAVLDQLDRYRDEFETMRATRDWFVRELRSNGFAAHGSEANFALIDTDSPSRLAAALARHGIRARDLSWMRRLDRLLRITITTESQMASVLTALRQVVGQTTIETRLTQVVE
jgi:histidinol-phosphate aminotransferase